MSVALKAFNGGKMIGEVKYALKPVGNSINELENKYLFRDGTQLMKNKSGQSFLISNMDSSEFLSSDFYNNLLIYKETIMLDVESNEENEAKMEANMKINSVNLDEPYLYLYDFDNKSYTFAIGKSDIVWNEFVSSDQL